MKILLIIIGTLLVLNGVGNIIDDSRVLTYDLTSILAGFGFLVIALQKKK
ncbi:MAG: hypothetical protein MI748_02425 [Opitutales bacterium]|nr:hypothetical protein [Opitutales bacterium]